MENAIRSELFRVVLDKLASRERESDELAREAICPFTPAAQRCEALIQRARVQTQIVDLSRELQRIDSRYAAQDRVGDSKADRRIRL